MLTTLLKSVIVDFTTVLRIAAKKLKHTMSSNEEQVKIPPSSPGLPDNMSLGVDPKKSLQPKPEICVSPATSMGDIDPWAMPEFQEQGVKWADLDRRGKIKRTTITILKVLALIALLYMFICSLDFLASGFRLIGGKVAGKVFQNNEHLKNPIVGLMIGVLATVIVQSSSTSTSIVVTMVASDFLSVSTAIPIVMGANIGTSVTNTLVSLAQLGDRDEFRRAFAGATVHDMFNWLSVICLLPVEVATGYLFHLTEAIVDSYNWNSSSNANKEMLTVVTKPFTKLIVQLDSKVINGIATGDEKYANMSLIKKWCKYETKLEPVNMTFFRNDTGSFERIKGTEEKLMNVTYGTERCEALLNIMGLDDTVSGIILLVVSLLLLCGCLIIMVKILHSMLRGSIAKVIKKTLNSDFPGRWAYFTGYVAIFVGCCMTILVQSSSIFTSALTPLVGIGVITVERMYPLTLGSNIGTTTTGLLAAMAATGNHLRSSVQIALCHLFFNISGILLFFPIPFMRFPIRMAQTLGDVTANYRWFSVFYLISMFFLMPAFVFALSLGGPIVMMVIGIPILVTLFLVIVINITQRKFPRILPNWLRTWDFLPEFMRSLAPLDRRISWVRDLFARCCKCCRPKEENLASMYNTSFHSRTAILNGSILTLPSQNNLDMKSMQNSDEIKGSGIVFTSQV